MKKIATLTSSLLICFSAIAQKTTVTETKENIGGGNNNTLTATLFNVDPSDADKAFKSFMKTYDGKNSSKDGGIFIDNATIKDISNNTIDIYGRANGAKGDKQISYTVAFDLGGAFLNSSEYKSQYKAAEKLIHEFAVKTTREAIEEQLKDAQKVQSKLEDAQKDLEKENKNLNSDIENYKAKIKKAEDDIVKNKANQNTKKTEIETQKKVVGVIEITLKAVE